MYFDPALVASCPFLAIFSFFFFRLLKSFLSDHPKSMPWLLLKFSQLSAIIYCFKHQLLIVFSCPINRWNQISFFHHDLSELILPYLSPNLFLFLFFFFFSSHTCFSLDRQSFSPLFLFALVLSRVLSSFTSVQLYPLPPDMTQILTYSGTSFQLTRLIISTQFTTFPSLSCFSVWPPGLPCFPLIEL